LAIHAVGLGKKGGTANSSKEKKFTLQGRKKLLGGAHVGAGEIGVRGGIARCAEIREIKRDCSKRKKKKLGDHPRKASKNGRWAGQTNLGRRRKEGGKKASGGETGNSHGHK